MSETYILPSDYYQTILTAARTGNRRELARTFRNTSEQRHPKLTAVYPQCYYVPVSTASMLYREAPTRYRSLALAALGPTTSPGYWGRMAVIARDAFDATDWTLLGWLAFYVDASTTYDQIPNELRPEPVPHEKLDTTEWRLGMDRSKHRVVQAFLKAFHLDDGTIASHEYLSAALAYFQLLPAGMAIPPDVLEYGTSTENRDQDPEVRAARHAAWPLLRMFAGSYLGAWPLHPQVFHHLAGYDHPMLPMLVRRLQQTTAPEARYAQVTGRRVNPFSALLPKRPQRRIAVRPKPAEPQLATPPAAPMLIPRSGRSPSSPWSPGMLRHMATRQSRWQAWWKAIRLTIGRLFGRRNSPRH